jgi:hypothetical protein
MNKELQLKKWEAKRQAEAIQQQTIHDVAVAISPPVVFTLIWLGVDWLTNHKNPRTGDWYLTPASGEILVTALGAAFVANAFGMTKSALSLTAK